MGAGGLGKGPPSAPIGAAGVADNLAAGNPEAAAVQAVGAVAMDLTADHEVAAVGKISDGVRPAGLGKDADAVITDDRVAGARLPPLRL